MFIRLKNGILINTDYIIRLEPKRSADFATIIFNNTSPEHISQEEYEKLVKLLAAKNGKGEYL